MSADSARWSGPVLLAVGIACAVEASTFNVGFLTDPVGPKALPYVAAAILVLAGIHAMLSGKESSALPSRHAWIRAGLATATFLAYAATLPLLGFFLSTTLVVALLSMLFGGRWTRALPSAAALAGALWLLFAYGLGLPLPIGDLWIR